MFEVDGELSDANLRLALASLKSLQLGSRKLLSDFQRATGRKQLDRQPDLEDDAGEYADDPHESDEEAEDDREDAPHTAQSYATAHQGIGFAKAVIQHTMQMMSDELAQHEENAIDAGEEHKQPHDELHRHMRLFAVGCERFLSHCDRRLDGIDRSDRKYNLTAEPLTSLEE